MPIKTDSLHLARPETEGLINLASVVCESARVPAYAELTAGNIDPDLGV